MSGSQESIQSLPPLRDIINMHELRAEKSLGQNFLLDLNLTAKIVRLAGDIAGKDAIEIGPGPGGLTRNILLQNVASLNAFEKDTRAIKALQSLNDASGGQLNLHEADALETDITTYGQDGQRVILANLPYNIATPLLIGWLRSIHERGSDAISKMVLMFQKEVGDRICAKPGEKQYGRLAIMSQFLCDVHHGLTIPPSAFTPPPKIHSSVVVFTPKPAAAFSVKPSFKTVEALTAKAFQQRRKMIRQSLKPYIDAINTLGIDPTLRAENLSIEDYLNIAALTDEKASND